MNRGSTPKTPRGTVVRAHVARAARTLSFAGHYVRLLLRANMMVAGEIVSRRITLTPAIVELPLSARTPLETATIAHLINLTPGTLVLEMRDRPPALYVHGMHAADPEAFRRDLSDLEDRFLRAVRLHGTEEV